MTHVPSFVEHTMDHASCPIVAGAPNVRQLGYQEANVIPMVRGITKYAALVDDPGALRYHLATAWRLASSGRPGAAHRAPGSAARNAAPRPAHHGARALAGGRHR